MLSPQGHSTAPMSILLSALLLAMTGKVQANPLLPRDDQAHPKAGPILAIILGCVVGGLALLFLLFGLWIWRKIKQNRRREAEAARAREEGRTSADTAVEGSNNELQAIGHQDQATGSGVGKSSTEISQTAIYK